MDAFLTVLHFFFITETKSINPKELKFLSGSEEEKQQHELDKDNCITLNPQYPKSCIYYFETITVKYKEKEIFNFQYLVYIDKENNIIIDLDEQNKPSFELMFYAKEDKLIPNSICYKNKE